MVEYLRLFIFLGLLGLLIGTEYLLPRRKRPVKRSKRWISNFNITLLNTFLAKFTLGAAPLAVSYYCVKHKLGLIQIFELTPLLGALATFILLDMLIYFQHRVFHFYPLLWRLHKVHHTDPDLDVTSGFRFHPVEILLSLVIKTAAVFVLGATPEGVLLFEICLSAGSLFNHSNIKIPQGIDRFLRLFIVTPDVHIIHHSTKVDETNSNFAFTISVWDRIFKTYRAQPEKGHDKIDIGLNDYPNPDALKLYKLLKIPIEPSVQPTEVSGPKI